MYSNTPSMEILLLLLQKAGDK